MRKLTSRAWLLAAAFAVMAGCLVFLMAGCGGGKTVYEVVQVDGASVTLLAPDGGKAAAKEAISAYLDVNTGASDSPKYLDIEVVKAEGASTYVCRSRYFADRATAAKRAGNPDISANGYPATTLNCP